jgi:hypothetical protein
VDGWFAAWSETDASARRAAFARIAAPDVRFRDRFSLVDGVDDLSTHVGAAQRFMPGVTLRREGSVRQCQGSALVDWIWFKSSGEEFARGTSVFVSLAGRPDQPAVGFMAPRT